MCHGDPDFNTTDSSGQTVSLYVDSTVFAGSIHDSFDCTDCHTEAKNIPHPENMPQVDCGNCHTEVASNYQYHGLNGEKKGALFPDCHHCHGTHNILPPSNPKSTANPNNLPHTCGRCHEDESIVGKYHIPMIEPVEIYETSVHARMRGGDSGLVATCVDCHSADNIAHRILALIYPNSTIFISIFLKRAVNFTRIFRQDTSRVSMDRPPSGAKPIPRSVSIAMEPMPFSRSTIQNHGSARRMSR